MLDLGQQRGRTLGAGRLTIGAHQAIIPIGRQRCFDNRARLVMQTARVERGRSMVGDERSDPICGRNGLPDPADRFGVVLAPCQQILVSQLTQAV